jgi:hypothetical protein
MRWLIICSASIMAAHGAVYAREPMVRDVSAAVRNASCSSAWQRARCALGHTPSNVILCVTPAGDYYWDWPHDNVAVDFWQDVLLFGMVGRPCTNQELNITVTRPDELPDGFCMAQGNGIAAAALWVALAVRRGVTNYAYATPQQLVRELAGYCGSCVNESGLGLFTAARGIHFATLCARSPHLPHFVTWRVGGLNCCGVWLAPEVVVLAKPAWWLYRGYPVLVQRQDFQRAQPDLEE